MGAIWVGAILQLKDIPVNSTFNYAENCGANNCPYTKLPEAASKPSLTSTYALCGTLNASCLLAIIITALFVDDLKYDDDLKPISRGKVTIQSISKFIFGKKINMYNK